MSSRISVSKMAAAGGLLLVVITATVLITYTLSSKSAPPKNGLRPMVYTNNAYIDGLYSDVNVKDSMAVFSYVFARLDSEVTIYPSENYFYFKFTARGRPYDGALMLFPHDRDSGYIELGYIMRIDDKVRQRVVPMPGGSANITGKEGLEIAKINNFKFALTFKGKTVIFNLFNDGAARPRLARLREDEEFVGPSFDESGLRFFLIFNRTNKNLFWVLNEDQFIPEEFLATTPNVALGCRTGFAFYVDSANNRKILVGVDGLNTLQNNWFDGPFDQMPDNYVNAGMVSVKKYLLAAYHLPDSAIDNFGRFVHSTNSRIPVAPYTVYYSRDDLRFVDSCKALNLPPADFVAQITKQRHTMPKEFLY